MYSKELYTIQPLFLKPLHYPGTTIFSRDLSSLNKKITFRSFNLDTDTDLIHQWVNLPYALPYWQLSGKRQRVFDLYYNIQRNSNGHSYIGMLDDNPICQFDVYRVLADEIRQFFTADENDCGFHLLMAPNENPIPGLTSLIIKSYLDYYFSFPQARRMFAEPDITNHRSNRVLKKVGFSFHHAIKMSYKTANLYSITKQQFHANVAKF